MKGQYSVCSGFLPKFEGSTFSSLTSNTVSHLTPDFPNTNAMLGSLVRKARDGFKSPEKKKEDYQKRREQRQTDQETETQFQEDLRVFRNSPLL